MHQAGYITDLGTRPQVLEDNSHLGGGHGNLLAVSFHISTFSLCFFLLVLLLIENNLQFAYESLNNFNFLTAESGLRITLPIAFYCWTQKPNVGPWTHTKWGATFDPTIHVSIQRLFNFLSYVWSHLLEINVLGIGC